MGSRKVTRAEQSADAGVRERVLATEKAAESRLSGFSLGVVVTRLDSQGIERRLVDRGGGVEAVISLITDEGFTR
jgi:hypothetical protein